MPRFTLEALPQVLQLSVAPAALISGTALLVLCATNRMAHLLDRLRALCQPGPGQRGAQVAVLVRRAHLLRLVVLSFLLAILSAVLVIASLFLGQICGFGLERGAASLFLVSLALVAAGLVAFAAEAAQNLGAVQLELDSIR